MALDVALVQLSPPDAHGLCSLGTSVDAARAAVDSARFIIAEINQQMPRTHGNTAVPFDRVDAFIHTDRPLPEHRPGPENAVEARIGEIVAGLIEDRSTLQMGIGAIPDAVLSRLANKHDLGVHTEMFSDRLIDLVEGGVITNKYKQVHAGRTTTSFVIGSRRLFDFVHDNLAVEFHPCDRTNDTAIIRRNPRVVAINSAIEVDLTGQVVADSFGHRIYSGIGGQMDFIRGAALSRGGKAIIAAVHRPGRQDLAHRHGIRRRRRRGDHARPRALGGHRVRRGEPARCHAARARGGADFHCPSGFPGGADAGPEADSALTATAHHEGTKARRRAKVIPRGSADRSFRRASIV